MQNVHVVASVTEVVEDVSPGVFSKPGGILAFVVVEFFD